MTTAEHLALVEAAIKSRLNGDAFEEHSEGSKRFRGARLSELYDIRDRLLQQQAAESGGNFMLAEPFEE